MALITSNEILLKYIPNVVVSVSGENTLYEKISSYITLAEEWVKNTFTSETTFNTICGYADSNVIKTYTAKVVVCEAFMGAIPSLDVVLTPNGFGIVSNSNVAPASKERVTRLIDAMETERDRAIKLLLSSVVGASKWTSSAQFGYFTATMFPNIDICDYVGIKEHRWERYAELRMILSSIEEQIESEFIGKEQMDIFRKEALSPSSTSSVMKAVVRSLRACEVQMLRDRLSATAPITCTPPTALVDIVNIIRQNEDVFPSWHNSSVAELFTPTIYENAKGDKGYWF